MPDNLTTLISRVQAMLLDDATQFTTATCTAAIREALHQFNQAAPVHAGTLIDTIADQYEYALNAADFTGLLEVIGVFYGGNPPVESANAPQDCAIYWLDNDPYIRLKSPLSAGAAVLDVRFTLPHTINGLDTQVESTLDTDQEQTLIDGACAAACRIRAADRTETVNLDPDTVAEWRRNGGLYAEAFRLGLLRYKLRPTPAGAPDTRAWNDEWHNWLR